MNLSDIQKTLQTTLQSNNVANESQSQIQNLISNIDISNIVDIEKKLAGVKQILVNIGLPEDKINGIIDTSTSQIVNLAMEQGIQNLDANQITQKADEFMKNNPDILGSIGGIGNIGDKIGGFFGK